MQGAQAEGQRPRNGIQQVVCQVEKLQLLQRLWGHKEWETSGSCQALGMKKCPSRPASGGPIHGVQLSLPVCLSLCLSVSLYLCVSVSLPSLESYFVPQVDLEFSIYPRLASVLWSSYFIFLSLTPPGPAKDAGSLRSLQILTSFGCGCRRKAVCIESWQPGNIKELLEQAGRSRLSQDQVRRTMGHLSSASTSLSLVKSLPDAPFRVTMESMLRGHQRGKTEPEAHRHSRTALSGSEIREDHREEISLRELREQRGASYLFPEHPLPAVSHLVICANAVFSPAAAGSSGPHHPRFCSRGNKIRSDSLTRSGPWAAKPLPFLGQENRAE